MSKFIPFDNKIEVKPFIQDNIILSEDKNLIEAGEVIAIGKDVKFVKVGDTLYFDSWGVSKTPKGEDGEEHYLVPESSLVILGKQVKSKKNV